MKKIFFLYFILSISATYGQILNDTTLPYGVFSTSYYLESDEKYFSSKRRTLDTTFMQFQNYEGVLTPNNFYQNLGVMGSASRAVFYDVNREIGLDHGYNAFGQYFMNPETQIYFDTRSPFSQINYMQGSTGENTLKLNLAMPITKRSSMGIDVGRYTARKIAGRTGDKNVDKLVSNFNLAAYFNYTSQNTRYKIFGNSTLVWNTQNENGGYYLDKYADKDSLFLDLNTATINSDMRKKDGLGSDVFNDRSFTNIYKNDVKIYQHYRLSKDSSLGVFHEFRFTRCTTNVFITPDKDNLDSLFFNRGSFYNSKNTTYSYRFDRLENKAGVAGKYKFFNYVLFVKNRYMFSKTLVTGKPVADDTLYRTSISENYVGGDLKFKYLGDKLLLNVYYEHKLANSASGYRDALYRSNLKNDYVFDFSLSTKFAKIGFLAKETTPSVIQFDLYHNNYNWANTFSAVKSKNLYLEAQHRIKRQYLALRLYHTSLDDYIYLDTSRNQSQLDKRLTLLRASFVANLSLWKFHLDNRFDIASSGDTLALPVPKYIWAPKVYFGSKFKTLNFHIGVEALYVSQFYAYNYNPEINNFSAQNSLKTYGKPVITPFLNGQIKNFSFWLKFSFVNQIIDKGYFTTPNYIGLPQTFSFGINWLLYE